MGRFLTRDPWKGNANNPVTFNYWQYADANPIIYTDPTGNCSWLYSDRIKTAEQYVLPQLGDSLTTYVVAGIAVQFWGTVVDINPGYYNGAGIAQTSQAMASTENARPVKDPGLNFLGIWLRMPAVRGYGVRCYLSLLEPGCPTVCLSPREIQNIPDFDSKYELEPIPDHTDPRWAVEHMRRRIKQVIYTCDYGKINCSETDRFIIVALVQNGPGFTIANMDQDIKINYLVNRTIDWKAYFPKQGNVEEFKKQLRLFNDLARLLYDDGYYLPAEILQDTSKKSIEDLINGRYNN